jgi:hypothetical protein
VDVRGEPDLSPQDERWLGEWAQEEHGSDFLFVTGYPMVKRPFYTHPDPARPGYSATRSTCSSAARSLSPAASGCTATRLPGRAWRVAGYPVAPFESYLEAFRYGMPPHGGFAIGLERLLMQLHRPAEPAADDALPARLEPVWRREAIQRSMKMKKYSKVLGKISSKARIWLSSKATTPARR